MPYRVFNNLKEIIRHPKNSIKQQSIMYSLYKTFCRYAGDTQKIKIQSFS